MIDNVIYDSIWYDLETWDAKVKANITQRLIVG
jgi:hypothetical protein